MFRKREQRKLDEALLHLINDGVTSDAKLRQIVKGLAWSCSVNELIDHFARTELSAGLQRLRAAGLIEIGPQGEPILLKQS